MQKWEYIRLKAEYTAFSSYDVRVNDDQVLHKQPLSEVHVYIKKLGNEGWELVSHSVFGTSLHEVFYFKRPIE